MVLSKLLPDDMKNVAEYAVHSEEISIAVYFCSRKRFSLKLQKNMTSFGMYGPLKTLLQCKRDPLMNNNLCADQVIRSEDLYNAKVNSRKHN